VIPVLSSKRIDILFFTTSFALFIYYMAVKMPYIPQIFVRISQCSFGIYLLHPLVLKIMEGWLDPFNLPNVYGMGIMVRFAGCVILSMLMIYAVNKIRWGPYLVGKIGIGREVGKSTRMAQAAK